MRSHLHIENFGRAIAFIYVEDLEKAIALDALPLCFGLMDGKGDRFYFDEP